MRGFERDQPVECRVGETLSLFERFFQHEQEYNKAAADRMGERNIEVTFDETRYVTHGTREK